MRKVIPLLLAGLLTFVAVWLFMDGWNEADARFDSETRTEAAAEVRDPLDHVRARRHPEGISVREEPLGAPGEAAPTHGELVIRADTGGAGPPTGLRIVTTPPLDEFEATDVGMTHDLVTPASYDITMWGGDVIPVSRRGVAVKAGHRTIVDVDIVRGIRPKGVLMHALDRRRLEGAVIDFNGFARVVTDANGEFEVEPLVPRSALRLITVTHEQFDDQVYRDIMIGDHREMELFLGGEHGVVVGEIVNASGRPVPERFVVKVTVEPLWEIRREFEVVGTTTFRVENLYLGRYRVEVHFPGGEFPTQREMVTIPPDTEVAAMRFELHVGATIEGRFLAPENLIPATRLELRDRANQVVARCGPDADGRYRIAGLKPGRYHPCVVVGKNSPRFLEPLEIAEGEVVLERDLDVLRARLVAPR